MPALTAIAGQGMMSNEAYDDLEQLSDYIGARVTGSPEAGQAIEWGLQKMRAMGLENVRAEKWQISRGWTRVSATRRTGCSHPSPPLGRFHGLGRVHQRRRRRS